MDLNGKVAIVTGAGSGIGHGIAERLSRAGAAVCVNYLGYEDTAKALAARLPRAIATRADVSSAAEVQAMVDRTVRDCAAWTSWPTTRASRSRFRRSSSTRRRGT